MKRSIHWILSAAVISFLAACAVHPGNSSSSNSSSSSSQSTSSSSSSSLSSSSSDEPDVFAGGDSYDGNSSLVACYWKNGYGNLINNSTSCVYQLSVNGSLISAVGGNGTLNSFLWTNGINTIFSPDYYLTSVAVSGSDIYVLGGTNDSLGNPGYVYWKNGAINTPAGLGTPSTFINNKTFVVNGPVMYFGGSYYNGTCNVAFIWTNGVQITLTNDITSSVYAIAVSGSDIYAGGVCGTNACYWKNGIVHILTNAQSAINAIAVSASGDVYCGGFTDDHTVLACCWKNDTAYPPLTNVTSRVDAITLYGSDVYAGGWWYYDNGHTHVACYWKNGALTNLSQSLQESHVSAISVRKKL